METENDRLLASRAEDLLRTAQLRRRPQFMGFLDGHERRVAQRVCQSQGSGGSILLWGGYPEAERVLLGAFPDWQPPAEELFPLTCVRITWRFGALTHRDFLGALLSLGLKRETIGDMAVDPEGDGGVCRVVCRDRMADFVAENLTRVGRCGVACAQTDMTGMHGPDRFAPIQDTVASPRLDCVVAALCGLSRAQAGELIAQGLVSVDFEVEDDWAAAVEQGAAVSIRGHGRFAVDEVGPPTRKGRLRLAARRYI